jgi:hypothetical protein
MQGQYPTNSDYYEQDYMGANNDEDLNNRISNAAGTGAGTITNAQTGKVFCFKH